MSNHEVRLRSNRSTVGRNVGNKPILSAERDQAMTIADCHLKDELVAKYEKIAREALAAQAEVEEREMLTRQELDRVLDAKAAADERLSLVEAALANSIEQLNSLEDEMEGKVRDAVVKGTAMFVERQVEFEEKLNEATVDFVNLSVENSRLVGEISAKDKEIEDLDRQRCMTESELDVVVMKLDGIEKENSFLRYEFQLMEKELAVRNEELEFCSRLVKVLHKKHLQGLKKVAKLEAKCQRLRILSQKRVIQSAMMRMPDSRKSRVMERLQALEDENEMLKEVIPIKDSDLKEARDGGSSCESSLCKECSSSESWANAPILELENFRKVGLQSTFARNFEQSLKPSLESDLLGAEKLIVVPLDIALSSDSSSLAKSSFDWLQIVLDAITKQHQISERDFEDLLLEVGIALGLADSYQDPRQMRKYDSLRKDDETVNHNVAGLLPWKAWPTTEMGNGDKIKTMEMAKRELEERLESAQQVIYRINDDAVRLKQSRRLLEDQIEHQKLINQDLESQLAGTKAELNEVMQKYYSLEIELEDQNLRCEELELTCIELELQLGGVATYPLVYDRMIQGPTLSRDDAEEQFAACKDAITDIMKHPKTLPSPLEASASSRASSDRSRNIVAPQGSNNRPSLHDRMLADGFAELMAMVVPRYTKIQSRRQDDALFTTEVVIQAPDMRPANAVRTAGCPPATAKSPRKRNGGGGFGFVRKMLIKNNEERIRSESPKVTR